MDLVEGNHSIVILSGAITPMALSGLRDLEQFGKSSKVLLLPPLARVEFGTQINLQVQEGRVEIIWKQPVLESGFEKVRKIATYFLNAYQAFDIKAVGINFNGLWLSEDDFDFDTWRSHFFKSQFLSQKKIGNLLSAEIKFSIQKDGFVQNITLSERTTEESKGIQVNVNNHFERTKDATVKRHLEIVNSAKQLLQETVSEINSFWITS